MGRAGVEMSDETKEEIAMAECGSCRAIVPLNSENCPECSISFSGVSDESLGECGACNGLVALDSTKCSHCGTIFVADDVVDVLRKWLTETGISIPILFHKFDSDGDGKIDSAELKSGLLSLNLADLPPSQVERLIKTIDEDGDGQIDLAELHETITGEKYIIDFGNKFDGLPEDISNESASKSDDTTETSSKDEDSADEEDSSDVDEDSEDADEEDSSDADEESEDADESEEDDSNASSKDESEDISESLLYKLGVAASEGGMSIRDVFESMDSDDDGRIDGPEFQKGIEELSGDKLSPAEVMELLDSLDEDSDGRLDPMELVLAIESLGLDISPDHNDSTEEMDDIIDDLDDEEAIEPLSILKLISDAMDEQGSTPNRFFSTLDKDADGGVDVLELTDALSELLGSEVSYDDIEDFLSEVDGDGDRTIDMIEFITALETLDDADDVIDDDARLSAKSDKPFPTEMHRKMMGKKWNDVVWPLIHLMFGLFIAAWLLNGMGGIGPLSIDGSGGNVALETVNENGYESWNEGDIYPCDAEIQVGECKNSLTPFSGDASSMPAKFYWDGILMMILGGIGLAASLVTHLIVVPGWRARAKAMKEVEDDTDEARSDDSDETDDDSDEEDEGESDDEKDDDSDNDEDESDDENDDDSDDDKEESESKDEDDIDIGSHVGLNLDDEEVFGVIVEFDDKEETVTIKEDGTGDLVTGYQDEMFLE